MTYDQLLPVYRQITGLPGQDDAFNKWVQGIIDVSGSKAGTDGIPNDFFNSPTGQQYVKKTTTVDPVAQLASGGATSAPAGSGGGFTQLTAPTPEAPNFTQAQRPDVYGGNYNQVQNAVQGGQFGTVGSNVNQQTGTTEQNQTGQTKTVGTTNTQQTNDSRTTGTTTQQTQGQETQQAIDTLGFGKLLKDQAGSVGATDAARQAWLQDTMQNGGTGFNSQVDQAIRNSLTGAQMTGAGDSARARAAGYGAAEVARTNLNQRLAAAEQLGGPTGLATLSTAANPFIGKSTTSTGNNTTFQDLVTKGTSNATSATQQLQDSSQKTTGFQDMLSRGSEVQAGTTQGQSSQFGVGQIPQGQPVKTGGCVLCTAAIEMKLPKANMLRVLRRVIKHKLEVDRSAYANAAEGYFKVFTPFARWLLNHKRIANTLFPMARAVVYEELRISGRRLPWKLGPWSIHWGGHVVCAVVGLLSRKHSGVTDAVITDIARRNNILFEVKS